MLKWIAVKVVITCISKHFSMYDIFRTTHRLTMIFSSKCRKSVIWQVLNTFRTIEYSTGPMRTHKETTNSTAKFGSKMAELKTPKIAHETKNWIFSKSKISIHQSNHAKRNIKLMLFWPSKHFRTTCVVPAIIQNFRFLPSQNTLPVRSLTERWFGRAKSEILQLSQRRRK